MDSESKLENILNGEIESRINAYVYLKELRKNNKFLNLDNAEYVSFEELGYNFFKKNDLTLNVFDRGKFFEYIKEISESKNRALIIDNLEIIQNILFHKNEFEEFFKEMQLQKFRSKVIFIFLDIRIMQIRKILNSNYPEKNIIIGDNNEN